MNYKIGQKIYCRKHQLAGEITGICSEGTYPIKTRLSDGYCKTYTKDGFHVDENNSGRPDLEILDVKAGSGRKRLFEVGDTVYSYSRGARGVVKEIVKGEKYPVFVDFDECKGETYTEDGRYTYVAKPSLVRIPTIEETKKEYLLGKFLEETPAPSEDADVILEMATEIGRFVQEKDRKYDSAFDKMVDDFGSDYYLSKLSEKLSRIKYMVRNGIGSSESVEDSLKDLIGYSLLTLRKRRSASR